MDSAILQLEESLQILEELIQCSPLDNKTTTLYIQRLKQFYSPQFDFEYSESGSYYYAALKSLSVNYLENDSQFGTSLSHSFQHSLELLIEISLLNMDPRKNQSVIIEKLVALATFWDLNTTLDMPDLIVQVLKKMRTELLSKNMQP